MSSSRDVTQYSTIPGDFFPRAGIMVDHPQDAFYRSVCRESAVMLDVNVGIGLIVQFS